MQKAPTNFLSLSPELLTETLSYLIDEEGECQRTRGTKNIVPLLTVCSTCYGPAVRLLWHTLFALEPLLYTLPSDVCTIQRDGPSDHQWLVSGMVDFSAERLSHDHL